MTQNIQICRSKVGLAFKPFLVAPAPGISAPNPRSWQTHVCLALTSFTGVVENQKNVSHGPPDSRGFLSGTKLPPVPKALPILLLGCLGPFITNMAPQVRTLDKHYTSLPSQELNLLQILKYGLAGRQGFLLLLLTCFVFFLILSVSSYWVSSESPQIIVFLLFQKLGTVFHSISNVSGLSKLQ